MELQTLVMTDMYLPLLLVVIVISAALLLGKVKMNTTKLYKPIAETGRDKGELVLGNYDTIMMNTTKLYKPVMETNRDQGELVFEAYYPLALEQCRMIQYHV